MKKEVLNKYRIHEANAARERLEREREIAQCCGCGAQVRLDLDGVWKGRCKCPGEER